MEYPSIEEIKGTALGEILSFAEKIGFARERGSYLGEQGAILSLCTVDCYLARPRSDLSNVNSH